MKLATLNTGNRDGEMIVVSDDLTRMELVGGVAYTMQQSLDTWEDVEPTLRNMTALLNKPNSGFGKPFDCANAAAVLPRAHQFLDGSVYMNHVELAREARGAEVPDLLYHEPLMYQAASDFFLPPTAPIPFVDESWGLDFEAEIGVVLDHVPMGIAAEDACAKVRMVLLINDISLRGLIPDELAKGFGFIHGKPQSALSPVAVTPDGLGDAWDGHKLAGKVTVSLNGEVFGSPEASADMTFDFGQLIAHAARTRSLGPGTIIGSGTVSNRDRSVGSCCITERRMIETLEQGDAKTPYLKPGDRVRIEMLDAAGNSIFGAIDQEVVAV